MNLFRYFQSKGIDTVDASFYRQIDVWKSWYKSNVKNFTTYRVYTGSGTYVKRRRKSLGMAKKLSEDIADLLLNERVQISLSGQAEQSFVDTVLSGNNFQVLGNEYQERKAYSGTVAYVPYLKDASTTEDGVILSGRIGINYLSAENIFPVSWENGIVTECIFAFPKVSMRKKYLHLQYHHKLDSGLYIIENMVLECVRGADTGKELTPEEWKLIKPFRDLAPIVETDSEYPQFVIDRLNIVNNADDDESNPMGVAIFANAIDVLKKIDVEYDSYCNEYELGRKRIFVAPELLVNKDGSPAFDPEDSVFYKMPDDYNEKSAEGLIKEIDLQIRADEHSKGINDDLNLLSLKCGFGTQRYRFENGQIKTATEVISVNSDMFRMIKKHEIVLDSAIKSLIRIILRLGKVLGNNLDETVEITIDFDDSIIEDKGTERQNDRSDVAMGAMPLWEYRMKWYGEDEDTAKSKVNIDDGIEEEA